LTFELEEIVTRHIARRMVLLLPTLVGLSIVTFALLRLIPGDPVQVMLGEHATPEQVERFRAEMGLDQPLLVQYVHYAASLVRGDWGRSIKTNLPVTTELVQRLPATLELGLAAMAIACIVGIPLGIAAARRPRSVADLLATGGTLLGVSIPLFWLGLLLAHLFGYRLGWLPPSGRLSIGVETVSLSEAYGLDEICGGPLGTVVVRLADFVSEFYVLNSILTANLVALVDTIQHLILPALTLSVVPLAVIARMTRSCLRDALAQDYVRTARAKGLPEHMSLLNHVLRNAWLPILTVISLQVGILFSGAILTETIFSWPGLGQLVVDRVLARDYPVVQGIVLVSGLLFVVISLATDALYAYLDPRIRYE
jgi:peptide/nickel transport system permease protein